MIQAQNITKTYNRGHHQVAALKEINFTIPVGSFTVIVGKSGSGKSTLLNLLGALDKPSSGQILFQQKDICQFNRKQQAQHRRNTVGFVFQSFNLIPGYTALENVMLALTFDGITDKVKEQRATELLKKVGLENRMDHKPSELSGGENQRVAIARALINNPPVILADEPTGNLDSGTSEQIIAMLKELNKEGKTIVMITHDRELAQEVGQQILTIHDGELK